MTATGPLVPIERTSYVLSRGFDSTLREVLDKYEAAIGYKTECTDERRPQWS